MDRNLKQYTKDILVETVAATGIEGFYMGFWQLYDLNHVLFATVFCFKLSELHYFYALDYEDSDPFDDVYNFTTFGAAVQYAQNRLDNKEGTGAYMTDIIYRYCW